MFGLFNAKNEHKPRPERSEIVDELGQWPVSNAHALEGVHNGWLVWEDCYIDILTNELVNKYRMIERS